MAATDRPGREAAIKILRDVIARIRSGESADKFVGPRDGTKVVSDRYICSECGRLVSEKAIHRVSHVKGSLYCVGSYGAGKK